MAEISPADLLHLPHLLQTVQARTLTGRLSSTHQFGAGESACAHLFFQDGRLIHAQVDPFGQIGEDALDRLLTWRGSQLAWHAPNDAYPPATTISDEMAQSFDQLMTILVEGEILGRPSEGDYDLAFFGLATSAPPPVAAAPPVRAVQRMRLIFPPGELSQEHTAQLAALDLARQIAYLRAQQWTGFVYYQPSLADAAITFGLLVLSAGKMSEVRFFDPNKNQVLTGQEALLRLHASSHRPEVFQVKERLLRAYRALLHEHRLPAETPATKAVFQQALDIFKQQSRTGVMVFSPDRAAAPLYFIFEGGQPLGLLGLDPATDRLQPLAPNQPLAFGDPDARLDIYLSEPLESAQPREALAR